MIRPTLYRTEFYIIAILFVLAALSGCAKLLELRTTQDQISTIKAAQPEPIKLNDVHFYVVTKDNLEEFMAKIQKTQGEVVWVALTMKDYENIALNTNELRRFILQQKEVIVYYEKTLKVIK